MHPFLEVFDIQKLQFRNPPIYSVAKLKKKIPYSITLGIPSGLAVKYPPAMEETCVQFLYQEDLLVMKWQPTSIFLPGKILWTEEPGGLQSIGSQRAGHD